MIKLKNNFIVINPIQKSFNNQHSKLCLLFYEKYLRIVIGSANLVGYDWELLENTVFVQDFPKLNNTINSTNCCFLNDMKLFLQYLSAPNSIIEQLNEYDFSACEAELVFSIPASHPQANTNTMCLDILKAKLKKIFENQHFENLELNYLTSSLGMITTDYIKEFIEHLIDKKNSESSTLRIIFPTKKYVKKSRLGPQVSINLSISAQGLFVLHLVYFPAKLF